MQNDKTAKSDLARSLVEVDNINFIGKEKLEQETMCSGNEFIGKVRVELNLPLPEDSPLWLIEKVAKAVTCKGRRYTKWPTERIIHVAKLREDYSVAEIVDMYDIPRSSVYFSLKLHKAFLEGEA